MTHLREEMYDTYAGLQVDVGRLAADAEHEGRRRLRRRRRVATTTSILSVLVVVGLASWTTSHLAGDERPVGAAAPVGGPVLTGPLSAVETLTASLARTVPQGAVLSRSGTTYAVEPDGLRTAQASVRFSPSSGAQGGDVRVDYWPWRQSERNRYERCHDDLADCDAVTLADGSVVLSYAVRGSLLPGAGDSLSWAASRVVDGTVVAIIVTAPRQAALGALGRDPVLTRRQLVELISQPVWSRLAPVTASD